MRVRNGVSWGMVGSIALAVLGGGCELVLDLPDSHLRVGQGGAGGSGGEGGAGVCLPGSTAPCYSGPAATENVGICKAGTKTCNAEGTAYSECAGDVTPGVEDCTKPEDEDCSGFACSQPLWGKDFPGLDNQKVEDVAVDGAGNVIVVGDLFGSANFGGSPLISAGGVDIFVAKFSSDGTHLWSRRFGDGSGQSVKAVAVDSAGNVLLTGAFYGSMDFGSAGTLKTTGTEQQGNITGFVAKLDASGSPLWAKRFGDVSYTSSRDVAVDLVGNVILVGGFKGTIDFGGPTITSMGGLDIFVTKLASAGGSPIWTQRFGDSSDQDATTVAMDTDGNVIFGGEMSGTVTFGVKPITGTDQLYVVKLDSSGGHSWSNKFGGKANNVNLTVDTTGSVVITGGFYGTLNFGIGATDLISSKYYNFFLAKLSAGGSHVWSKNTELSSKPSSPRVAVDKHGNVLLANLLQGTADFGGGVFTSIGMDNNVVLVKYDSAGKHVWSKRFGDGASAQSIGAIAIEPVSNAVVLGGWNGGTIDFGTGPLTSAGGIDAVLAKFAP